jgi:4-hydroxybenzoate polyprenyltransferase
MMGVLPVSLSLQTAVAAARPHHWAKNVLVFVPILIGHHWGNVSAWRNATWCFVSFSLFASFVYILNDLLDRDSDRDHPSKRLRPIASGQMTRLQAGAVAVVVLAGAAFFATWLPPPARMAILGYVLGSTVYSTWAKSLVLVDVIFLGGFYTLRVIAGGLATLIVISPWTLAFSMFLFLSLALAKRYVEVDRYGPSTRRGYKPDDMYVLLPLGIGCGLLAVLVLALYIYSPEVRPLYRRPELLWLMCPVVLYWIARIWLLAARGELSDDPVVFALHDAASYAAGACAGLVLIVATFTAG